MSSTAISRFIVWICKRFNRDQVFLIAHGLLETLDDPNAKELFKDHFKEEHPNYRSFEVDPLAPVPKSSKPKKKRKTTS